MPPLNNIDVIIKEVFNRCNTITKMEKLDGITSECTLKARTTIEQAKEELQEVCKELGLLPISVEKNPTEKKLFALQFPELNIVFTDKEIEKMYKEWYKWLLDNAILKNKTTKITKQLLIESKDNYVKLAIKMFCRSNINPYKDNEDNYLNNKEYRQNLDNIYYSYLDDYCLENNIM